MSILSLQTMPMAYESSLTQNGVATQMMSSAMSSYQRPYSTPVSAAYPQALQTSAWMHPQAATQYIVQPHMAQMIPSGLDPNTLHFSTLMPQLTAQMSQIQLSGVSGASYVTGNPHAYGTQALYTPQLIQTVPMAGDVSFGQTFIILFFHYYYFFHFSLFFHSDHRKPFAIRVREREE